MIAGASTGIGRATALRLAAEGADVIVGSPSVEQSLIASLVEEIRDGGGRALGLAFDAAGDPSIAAFVAAGVAHFGGIDVFHANFADLSIVAHDTDAITVSEEILDRTLDVNLKGMLRATRHAVPRLLERGGGAMIYTSSGAAIQGLPVMPCYAMAKSGLHALVRHVASRWGKDNVRANAILPGFVITPEKANITSREAVEQVLATCRSPRLGRPEDIAAMVAMLASSDGEWINGQCYVVDGGMLI